MTNQIDGIKMDELKEPAEVDRFVKTWCVDEIPFHVAMNEKMIENKVSLSALMDKSRVNKNYGYNLINGRRTNPGRDKVLAMCIAAQLSYEETQEMLMRAKVGGLYYRCERDVRIVASLNNKVGDVLAVNIELEENGLQPLDV